MLLLNHHILYYRSLSVLRSEEERLDLSFKTIHFVTTCDNNPNGPVTRQSANVCATGKSNFKLCNVACLATKRLTSIKCAQADADAAFSESSSLIPLSFGINCTSPVFSPSSKLPGIINASVLSLQDRIKSTP